MTRLSEIRPGEFFRFGANVYLRLQSNRDYVNATTELGTACYIPDNPSVTRVTSFVGEPVRVRRDSLKPGDRFSYKNATYVALDDLLKLIPDSLASYRPDTHILSWINKATSVEPA